MPLRLPNGFGTTGGGWGFGNPAAAAAAAAAAAGSHFVGVFSLLDALPAALLLLLLSLSLLLLLGVVALMSPTTSAVAVEEAS